MSDTTWLVPKEAAERARVSARTIYHEVKQGRLRAARVGGRRELRFRPEWVDAWLDATATPVEIKRGPVRDSGRPSTAAA